MNTVTFIVTSPQAFELMIKILKRSELCSVKSWGYVTNDPKEGQATFTVETIMPIEISQFPD